MKDKQLEQKLDRMKLEDPVLLELFKLIPDWSRVNLTKKGFNNQYVNTLLDVAIYIREREIKLLGDLYENK